MRWELPAYFLEMCGLAVWFGGLFIIIAVVIPAVFNSFGMEPAGRFLRRIFDGYSQVTLGVLMVLGINLAVRSWFSARKATLIFPVMKLEYVLITAMLVVTVLIIWVFGPETVALQEAAFQAVTEIEKQTAYDRFFQMHMIVRGLYLTNAGLAVGLFIMKLRQSLMRQLALGEG
ncbi:MAG: DUF4149 domain-containing protein [Nitrospirae bacterium]|nr:MAG: DUF4149 domain-containing protein [Nitrospirota bacterium]